MEILRKLYTAYVAFVFIAIYVCLFPFFFVLVKIDAWHPLIFLLQRFWANSFFVLSGVRIKKVYHEKPSPRRAHIFCANHFSYFDTPTMYAAPCPMVYVGKDNVARIPLIGFLFRHTHIMKSRSKSRQRFSAYIRMRAAIDRGLSIVIFPEGGIFTTNPPHMIPFREGAFRLAIEKQIPIVPVTIPYNWIILPDDGKFTFRGRHITVIYHKAIETRGMTAEDLEALKQQTFNIIDSTLKQYNEAG